MLIHQLTRPECLELLRRRVLGRLACARDGQPYVVPVFLYGDGDCLYSFSTVGQKIDWMRRNPKVCVEVDDIADQFHWTTMVIFGRFEELDAKRPVARQRALELFQEHTQWWLPGAGKLTSGDPHETSIVFRIRIQRISGRRAARG